MVSKRKSREPGEMTEKQAMAAACVALCSGPPIVEPIVNFDYSVINNKDLS